MQDEKSKAKLIHIVSISYNRDSHRRQDQKAACQLGRRKLLMQEQNAENHAGIRLQHAEDGRVPRSDQLDAYDEQHVGKGRIGHRQNKVSAKGVSGRSYTTWPRGRSTTAMTKALTTHM